jgi:hypothetical protein
VSEDSDAVAGLDHEVGSRLDVGVTAADLDDDGRFLAGQREFTDGFAE